MHYCQTLPNASGYRRDCISQGYVHWSASGSVQQQHQQRQHKQCCTSASTSSSSSSSGGNNRRTLNSCSGCVCGTNNNLLPIILCYTTFYQILVFITNKTFQIFLFSIHVIRFTTLAVLHFALSQKHSAGTKVCKGTC